jgi:hypothetical protein
MHALPPLNYRQIDVAVGHNLLVNVKRVLHLYLHLFVHQMER